MRRAQAATGWVLAALLSLTFFCNDLAMGPAWACCADIGERDAGTQATTSSHSGNLSFLFAEARRRDGTAEGEARDCALL